MEKQSAEWNKVSFKEKKAEPKYKATFRATGRITLNAAVMEALGTPQYICFYASPKQNLIAMQASGKEDVDAVRVAKTAPENGKEASFVGNAVYKWLSGLLKKDDSTIALSSDTLEDGKIVFDLKKADISAKRTVKRGKAEK